MAHLAANEVCAWLATLGDAPPTAQTIDPDAVTRVKLGLSADFRGLLYSASVSLLSAIDVAQRASFSWAIVKLYYCSFYAARSILASNGTCIFYQGSKPYSLTVAPGESPKRENGVTHKVVWSIFAREFAGNALLNDIDGVPAHNWMTRLREDANYKNARFPDPIVPTAFALLDRVGVEPAMAAYRADNSYLYTFDPDHAAVAFPMSCIAQARRALLRSGEDFDAEEADYIRRLSEHIGVDVELLL